MRRATDIRALRPKNLGSTSSLAGDISGMRDLLAMTVIPLIGGVKSNVNRAYWSVIERHCQRSMEAEAQKRIQAGYDEAWYAAKLAEARSNLQEE